MVKKYSQLYLDLRRSLLTSEDTQTAGYLARNVICHVSQKTQEALISDSELYASEQICTDCEAAVARLLAGEPPEKKEKTPQREEEEPAVEEENLDFSSISLEDLGIEK